MNQFTKGPQTPHPTRTGETTTGTILVDTAKAEAWRLRWECEFRYQRWEERGGKLYPRTR